MVRLAIVTSLPVSKGVDEARKDWEAVSKKLVSVRMSGSTVAELVNWAMAKGLVPGRYDAKGKPKKDGEYLPGLDWAAGEEHPMKVYLWDLDKPCLRVTMAAKPVVGIADESLEIRAEDVKADEVEASALTKVAVWFRLFWKDALKLQKKASAKARVAAAGKDIDIAVKRAAVEGDELKLWLSLRVREK